MPQALPVTLGDQVRLRFVGWPESIEAVDPETKQRKPHPKANQPLTMTWNTRPYVVWPGQDAYIPFELAKTLFGDPRSVENVFRIKDDYGNDQIIPDRFAEVRRLQTYWQRSVIKFREYIPGDRSFMDEGISDLLPNVEVYSLSGERIYMVTDDPYGDTVMVMQQTKADQDRNTQVMYEQSQAILELQKQNKLLLEKLGIRAEDLAALNDPEVMPKTRPTNGALETPTEATVKEAPNMVFNPRTRRVEPKRVKPDADPTSISELPTDLD